MAMIWFTVVATVVRSVAAGSAIAATFAAVSVGPVAPRGIVKFKITFSAVPVCVTSASVSGSPVVVVPTVTVGVVPSAPAGPMGPVSPVGPVGPVSPVGPVGPVSPVGPVGPVSPVGPVGPVAPVALALPAGPCGPVAPVALVTYGIFFAMCARYSSRLWGLRNL